MKMNKIVSAVDIVKRHHLSYQTVNYYTNLGLLKVIRNKGNKRLYDQEEVESCLEKIKVLQSRGYPLRVIREELLHRGKR